MRGKRPSSDSKSVKTAPKPQRAARPSSLPDTRIICCGDCLEQRRKLPDGCVDMICIDMVSLWHRFPTGEFNSNRNYEVFRGHSSEPRPSGSGPPGAFEDRHESTLRHNCPNTEERLLCQEK